MVTGESDDVTMNQGESAVTIEYPEDLPEDTYTITSYARPLKKYVIRQKWTRRRTALSLMMILMP